MADSNNKVKERKKEEVRMIGDAMKKVRKPGVNTGEKPDTTYASTSILFPIDRTGEEAVESVLVPTSAINEADESQANCNSNQVTEMSSVKITYQAAGDPKSSYVAPSSSMLSSTDQREQEMKMLSLQAPAIERLEGKMRPRPALNSLNDTQRPPMTNGRFHYIYQMPYSPVSNQVVSRQRPRPVANHNDVK